MNQAIAIILFITGGALFGIAGTLFFIHRAASRSIGRGLGW